MHYKEIAKTTGLIILSLAALLLLYFGIEQITDYFYDEDLIVPAIISNASLSVIIYFLVRWFNKKVNGLSISEYGFDSKVLFKNFFSGVFIAAAIIFVCFLAAYFIGGSKVEFIGFNDNYLLSLIEFTMIHLVVGAWEELYFRGLVVNTLLKRKLGFMATAVISSILFTLLHIASYDLSIITPYWVFGVFFVSIIMLLLYVLTRSIWTPIGFHFCWDFMFTAFEEGENEFGLVQMKTYVQDTMLIDNISIVVTGVVLVLFMILMRKRIRKAIQKYCEAIR